MSETVFQKRLRAAFLASPYESITDLAKALESNHATVSRIFNGHVKRPRMLGRLAELLVVTPEWLMGQTDSLPFSPWEGAYDLGGLGADRFRSIDGLCGPRGFRVPEVDPDFVTRRQVIENRFLTRCYEAIVRDVSSWSCVNEDGSGVSSVNEVEDTLMAMVPRLMLGCHHLINPALWRNAAITIRTTEDVFADATVLVSWAEVLLEPWLVGRTSLNGTNLQLLLSMLYEAAEKNVVNDVFEFSYPSISVLHGLEMYGQLARRRTKARDQNGSNSKKDLDVISVLLDLSPRWKLVPVVEDQFDENG